MPTWVVIIILLVAINAAMLLGIRYEGRRARRKLAELARDRRG